MKKHSILIIEIFTCILCIMIFLPLVLVFINSAKDSFSVTNAPLALPDRWGQILENMKAIWLDENMNYSNSFFSSAIITMGSLMIITFSSSMAAWMLVRTKTKVSTLIFLIFVSAMVIPFQVLMLPLVSWFRIVGNAIGIKLLRSHIGMIFAYMGFGAPLSIFLFHGFIKSIPLELEEAARIDGCSVYKTFFLIVFPILKPVYMTVLILNGIWIWNDFLLPILLLGKGNRIQTIPLAVSNFAGSFIKEWDLILTAVLMSMIPVVIFFIFAQKYIIRGMVEGAIK